MWTALLGLSPLVLLVGFAHAQVQQPDAPPGRAAAALPYLLHETFADGQLTEGLWQTRLRLVTRKDVDPTQSGRALGGLNNLGGGYLHFWDPRGADPPYLCSRERSARRPGRCLAVGFCGTVHRGGPVTMQFADQAPPEDRFGAGPGWAPGQFQPSLRRAPSRRVRCGPLNRLGIRRRADRPPRSERKRRTRAFPKTYRLENRWDW